MNVEANPIDDFAEPDFEKLLGGIDPVLVASFFNYFSRFEHALKMRKFTKLNKGYIVGVDWNSYSPAISYPMKIEVVDKAVEYLCHQPVKRQRDDLSWESAPEIDTITFDAALRQVPYIRNNLFHGGKYLKPNPKRDNALISAAIVLIKACLICDSQLKHEFDLARS
ncbi:hypothetical protein ACLEXA_11980 [Pseudescherichia vulneris]